MTDSDDNGLARLESVVDSYGSRPSRWPEAERDQLEALLRAQPRAREIVERAAPLDAILDQAAPTLATAELIGKLLSAAPSASRRQWRAVVWPFGPIWQPLGGLAAAALLSVVLTLMIPLPEAEAELVAEIETDMLG